MDIFVGKERIQEFCIRDISFALDKIGERLGLMRCEMSTSFCQKRNKCRLSVFDMVTFLCFKA